MGSVQDFIQCSQCDYPQAFYTLYYRSDEESVFCPRCGYSEKVIAIIDRIKSKKKNDGRSYYKLTKDGHRIYRRTTNAGFGVYTLINAKSGVVSLGRMPKGRQNRYHMLDALRKSSNLGLELKVTIADGKKVVEMDL